MTQLVLRHVVRAVVWAWKGWLLLLWAGSGDGISLGGGGRKDSRTGSSAGGGGALGPGRCLRVANQCSGLGGGGGGRVVWGWQCRGRRGARCADWASGCLAGSCGWCLCASGG